MNPALLIKNKKIFLLINKAKQNVISFIYYYGQKGGVNNFVKRTIILTAIITFLVVIVLSFMRKFSFAGGFLVGSMWSMINYLLTIGIFEIALLKKDKNKLLALLIFKFPVLYVIGFIILILRVFPVISIIAGVPMVLVVSGACKLWPKLK